MTSSNLMKEAVTAAVDTTQRQHVIPNFGPEHIASADCWCHPEPLPDAPLVFVHHVLQ